MTYQFEKPFCDIFEHTATLHSITFDATESAIQARAGFSIASAHNQWIRIVDNTPQSNDRRIGLTGGEQEVADKISA